MDELVDPTAVSSFLITRKVSAAQTILKEGENAAVAKQEKSH